LDTSELDRILESLESEEVERGVYGKIKRCEELKEISDRLILDNEAVNKTIISINYSNNIK
jgi:coenzyme F420-reducing hydrogenase delta subunit